MRRLRQIGVPLLMLLAGELGAVEVYRSTGPHGEVRFSDVETPGSEAVTLETPEPASGDAAAWVEETLAVALALQEARLAREAAAAERRAALRERTAAAPLPAAPRERISYAPWYPYPYRWPPHGGYHPGRPDHPPWRPERPPPAPPQPPSMKAPIPGADWAERN